MSIQKVEMTVEQKENGQYVEQVAYPYVEYEHVTMENGMDIMSMIRDDVSTPMVTHNTTSWKVGQGDSDVSESIVDSSVGDMTIKGQTYQNILPSPSLRNSMTNGKTMQKLNEGYDNANTADGVVKSAILTGQTLVNLAPNSKVIFQKAWAVIGSVGSLRSQNNRCCIEVDVKPNTIYTIYSNSETYIRESKEDYTVTKSTDVFTNGVRVITTLSETTKLLISFRKDSADTIYTEIEESYYNVILEGDYTNVDIPYFEGMQSVKMPVLTTTGKNLWGDYIWDSWSESSVTHNYAMPGFKPNCKYTVSASKITIPAGVYYRFYVGGGYLLSYDNRKGDEPYEVTNLSHTLSTNENGELILGDYFNNKNNIALFKESVENLQLEEGFTSTSYEPYKSNILTVNEPVELRGIGGVRDELDLLTGEVTERIGYYKFTGDENFRVGSNYGDEIVFAIPTTDYMTNPYFTTNGGDKTFALTTGFKFIGQSVHTGSTEESRNLCMSVHMSGTTYFRLRKDLLNTVDVDGFKKFIRSNPTEIVMKLSQESIKTVDLSILDQDNQPVTQLNSFANGYIQVSSQEGTLIPTTEYEVPTSNSYHVDLMKPNTQYTMKNMQGTFTIDGIQYNASVNGTFTSPSTLSNRLMITNMVQTQPMLLEGDMTNKEVPYVEGIKSTFEGVDKVEIVSQNADNGLSNTTSFQLAHPLRSLPNGVRDKIVLDRVNHKAKIIQRVGEDLTQLDTPIITEVNLEGYPYVYKGGHISLNTEIAPITEVTYSINQAHQIESSNEDILRHQKEINQLYELIAQYVQVQYEAELIDIALQG